MDAEYYLVGAMLVGFFSAPHCMGMCGGIAGALAVQGSAETGAASRWTRLAAHNLGRLTTYALLGFIAGTIGFSLRELAPVLTLWFRVAAGLVMVAMGLYIAGWWTGLRHIENAGFRLWEKLAGGGYLARLARARAYLTGLTWGFLPCGLVYTMLVTSMATGSGARGALAMLAFGVGTLPALVAAGAIAGELAAVREIHRIRAVMGATIILFGAWTAASAVWMAAGASHH